jgi:hypothetical protein
MPTNNAHKKKQVQERQHHRANVAQRLDRHSGYATAVYNTGYFCFRNLTRDHRRIVTFASVVNCSLIVGLSNAFVAVCCFGCRLFRSADCGDDARFCQRAADDVESIVVDDDTDAICRSTTAGTNAIVLIYTAQCIV